MFRRVLIANRGEIALRILRACRELGIEAVCVYSQADRDAPYLELADRAICIGPGPAKDSYLSIPRLMAAAEIADVDAIHPGYGFLAERADFAEICEDCRIAFIGPSAAAMRALGDKVEAKKAAKRAKVPVFPGSDGAIEEEDEAIAVAREIGYPVIVKAAAGGGGRGMRVCHNEASLRGGIKAAQKEAQAAFGDGSVFIEKFLEKARHVEVQVLGDKHGHAVHLFERDCSTQRRHQKLVEEAPGPGIDRRKIAPILTAASRLIRNTKYAGAATVEFLMDEKQSFYMLEVNTRVQVEHPVTEMITGLDIVKLSITIAAGEPLPVTQRDIKMHGHAIECRINAEDPAHGFRPSPGRIDTWSMAGGPGVRIDSHVRPGYTVPPNYDSMVGKLIVHADTRAQAVSRMRRALRETEIGPIRTTVPLYLDLLTGSPLAEGAVDIHFVERLLKG